MEQILTDFISTWGYAAITILILLENILPFIPSEIILTFAGLIYLGKMLSGSWDMLMNGLHAYSYIMYVIIILAVIFIVYRLFKKNRAQ